MLEKPPCGRLTLAYSNRPSGTQAGPRES
jgi:hypothetical protein